MFQDSTGVSIDDNANAAEEEEEEDGKAALEGFY